MNTQSGGHVDVGRRYGLNKELGVRFNGVYRNGDTAIDHQSRESRLAAFGIDYRGDRVRWSTDLGYQHQNLEGVRVWSSVDPGVPVPAAPNNRTNASPPWDFVRPEVFYGMTRAEVDLTPDVTAFAAIGGNRRHEQSVYLIRSISDVAGALAPTTIEGRVDAMYTLSLETGLRGNFSTGPVKHQAAVSYARLDVDWRSASGDSVDVPASNIYNPIFGPAPSSIPDPADARKSRASLFSSVGLADTLSILDDRVQLTGGVRVQALDVKRFDEITGARRSRYDESATTPMAGLVVKPWSNVSLYANYIEGLQQGPVAPLGTVNSGEIFPPFVTQQYEAGVKLDWGSVATTLAAYQIAQPSSFVNPTTNVFGVDGEQRHRGLELSVFGEPTPGVRLLGGATYIDSALLNTSGGSNDGNRGPGVPKYRLALGAEWDTPFVQGLTLWGRLIYNGSQFIDQANTQSIPDWTRMDIGARYALVRPDSAPIIIRASIENVASSNYWVGGTFGNITPSDPLTFKLSTTFTF
jgi:iron complex outermembrane receptor protein